MVMCVVQMNVCLDRVRDVVGPEQESGVSDAAIREALWEYYFDVDQTIEWVFGTHYLSDPTSCAHPPCRRANEAARGS
jgi:hypothetical protein